MDQVASVTKLSSEAKPPAKGAKGAAVASSPDLEEEVKPVEVDKGQ